MPAEMENPPRALHWRYRLRERPSGGWRRFSLRGLLLLTTLCCILLGLWAAWIAPYRTQWTAVGVIADLKGVYNTEPADGSPWQRWLVTKVLGDDKFVRVTSVNLQQTAAGDDTLALIGGLRELKELNLDRTKVTDQGLASLVNLPKLETLSLRYTQITDAGLRSLDSLPDDLQELALTGTRVTDASADYFEGRSILDLYIRWTDITPNGADRIKAAMRRGSVHYYGSASGATPSPGQSAANRSSPPE